MKLLELYRDKVWGAISGLDRIRFRGTWRWLANEMGMRTFLGCSNILLKDYSEWAANITQQVRDSCQEQAKRLGIERRYLSGSLEVKEDRARQIAEAHGIEQGPICLLSVVEPCVAPSVKGNRGSKQLELKMSRRKCVWFYYYFNDPRLGFGHVRLQSWLPLTAFVCLNGRHWLERQLQKEAIAYRKEGNCFPWIENLQRAQQLLDQQLKTDWSSLLDRLLHELCPDLNSILPVEPHHYWSAEETEWATDLLFRSTRELDILFPSLISHALKTSDSGAIMRFFGRNNPHRGLAPKELVTDYRRRYEGVRIKHSRNFNSVKMYNKVGSILRVETTINNTRDFKVLRRSNDDPEKPLSRQRMRKGVSDLYRRCQFSQQCNTRYGDALAAAQVEKTLQSVLAPACNRLVKKGKRYRAINPWQEEDYGFLRFLAQGEVALNGFRNQDLRETLYPPATHPVLQKRLAARTTRRIRLLRAHGLIRKAGRENRYVLTPKGRQFSVALMNASHADIKTLTEMAA